jgi:hypothetical protein
VRLPPFSFIYASSIAHTLAPKRHLQFIRMGPDKVRRSSDDGGKIWKAETSANSLQRKEQTSRTAADHCAAGDAAFGNTEISTLDGNCFER